MRRGVGAGAAREAVAVGDRIRVHPGELWALLPPPQQDALFAAVHRLAARAQPAR